MGQYEQLVMAMGGAYEEKVNCLDTLLGMEFFVWKAFSVFRTTRFLALSQHVTSPSNEGILRSHHGATGSSSILVSVPVPGLFLLVSAVSCHLDLAQADAVTYTRSSTSCNHNTPRSERTHSPRTMKSGHHKRKKEEGEEGEEEEKFNLQLPQRTNQNYTAPPISHSLHLRSHGRGDAPPEEDSH